MKNAGATLEYRSMEGLAILYSVVNNPSALFLASAMVYFGWVSRHLAKSKIQEWVGHKDSAEISRAKSRNLCAAHARPVMAAWQSLRHAHRQAFPQNLSQAGAVGRDLAQGNKVQARQPRRAGRRGHGGQKKASNDDGDGGASDGGPPHGYGLEPLLEYEDLGQIIKLAPGTLKNLYSKSPELLPPAVKLPGHRGPLWLPSTVLGWLEAHQAPAALPTLSKATRRGRPRIAQAGKGGVSC
ncbi:MAG: hypothetical protein ACYCQH_09265 [Acidithiobacillus ferrooxidans]